MPAKGGTQTEETKKKISEALKKNGGLDTTVKRSPVAQKLFKKYSASKSKTNEMKAEINQLVLLRKSAPKGKAGAKAREAAKTKIKAIREKMKVEAEVRADIVRQAKAERRVKQARIVIEKSKLRVAKLQALEKKVQERQARAKTPEQKKALKEYLKRISDLFSRQALMVKEANKVIKSKGTTAKTSKGMFDFSELIDMFSERDYKPYRELTTQEKRANLELLNNNFNKIESELENAFLEETSRQIDAIAEEAEKVVEEDDMSLVDKLLFGGLLLYRRSVASAARQAYEVGKQGAAQEVEVPVPPTDKNNTEIQKAEAEQIAQMYTQEMENEVKSTARNAILAGATANVAAVAIRNALNKRASEMISGITGTIPGQNINRGRKQVFYENLAKITHFQRSEVLDSRTCNICLSLDKRILPADDPFTHLEVVHSHCRGTWVPIFNADEAPKASAVGIPKTVRGAFDSIDGRPVVNDFKQIKKPMNTKENPDAQEEIKRRLEKKKV